MLYPTFYISFLMDIWLHFAFGNNAAMNVGCRYLLGIHILISLHKHPEVGLLDYIVVLFLIFWGISILFSIMAVIVYVSPSKDKVFYFLYILTKSWYHLFCFCLFVYNIHPNTYEMISHCEFFSIWNLFIYIYILL